jgi:hypothetical protein
MLAGGAPMSELYPMIAGARAKPDASAAPTLAPALRAGATRWWCGFASMVAASGDSFREDMLMRACSLLLALSAAFT